MIEKISDSEFKSKSVSVLADKPNVLSTVSQKYGQSGLNANQLKAWFDGLPTLLKLKTNEIIEALNQNPFFTGENAAEHISVLFEGEVQFLGIVLDKIYKVLKKIDERSLGIRTFYIFNSVSAMYTVLRDEEINEGDSFVFLDDDGRFEFFELKDAVSLPQKRFVPGLTVHRIEEEMREGYIPVAESDILDETFKFKMLEKIDINNGTDYQYKETSYYFADKGIVLYATDFTITPGECEDGDVFKDGKKQ